MTSKIVVNNIEADAGVSTVTFGSNIVVGNSFINSTSIGIGTTDTTGRNAGVGTAQGTIIYNTTTNTAQIYTSSEGWVDVGNNAQFSATGGDTIDTSTRSGYKVHIFTSPGTFSVTSGSKTVEYVVVAGGGGSAAQTTVGGGGGGGVRSGTLTASTGEYPVVRGAGGGGVGWATLGNKGSNSNLDQ